MRMSRKGILESIPEFFQIVIALAIAVVLISLTFYFFSLQTQSRMIEISGDVTQISSALIKHVENCWKDNRNGLNSQSSVCNIIKIKISQPGFVNTVTENNVTRLLHCDVIPNDDCFPDDCSGCVSPRYPDDQQDKIRWEFDNSTVYMQISYSGADRLIEISNTVPPEQ